MPLLENITVIWLPAKVICKCFEYVDILWFALIWVKMIATGKSLEKYVVVQQALICTTEY